MLDVAREKTITSKKYNPQSHEVALIPRSHFRLTMPDKLAITALFVLLASAMSCASLLDMKCVREGTEDEARAWFAKGDTDDDGVISEAEFETWESRLRLQIKTFLFEVVSRDFR